MRTSKNTAIKVLQGLCACLIILAGFYSNSQIASAESTGANVLFILDGSGSMCGRLEDVEKIVIAKERLSELIKELPENVNIGLIVSVHRSRGDCHDIELVTPLDAGNRETILKQIQAIHLKDQTPITKSIELAAQQLETIEDETSIVLVSDDEETCEGDPCGYTRSLKEKGLAFTMHVVGFDVNAEQQAQLECIANAGGGRYFSAQNALQLKAAFAEVKTEVIKKAEAKPDPKAGDIWTEPATGMEFVWIPGGCFQMGQTEQEKQKLIEEMGEEGYKFWYIDHGVFPQHRVCVDGFWMGKYEVTNAQYRVWDASHDSRDADGVSLNGESLPVVFASWEDATAFTEWLTKRHSMAYTFRLPTEAEWEYAARAGTTSLYFWGDDLNDICQYANVGDQATKQRWPNLSVDYYTCHDGYAATAPVGSFRPNPFGLYDIIGNMFEYCQDWHDVKYYGKSPLHNPQGPASGEERIIRGGSWIYYPFLGRSAYRDMRKPNIKGFALEGFRVVKTP
ncbi:hypothetical protein U27_05333 [Candidatus Vecturithrix granuli]|uniref:VWFA domain-containing protein n=1 Tax=Vecturithrix granuli TaxID=1499967 RepID=A0A081C1A4_VECG1|nr:hypothetical protein U27_05333 [Candidatus Vecturithrix granuli]